MIKKKLFKKFFFNKKIFYNYNFLFYQQFSKSFLKFFFNNIFKVNKNSKIQFYNLFNYFFKKLKYKLLFLKLNPYFFYKLFAFKFKNLRNRKNLNRKLLRFKFLLFFKFFGKYYNNISLFRKFKRLNKFNFDSKFRREFLEYNFVDKKKYKKFNDNYFAQLFAKRKTRAVESEAHFLDGLFKKDVINKFGYGTITEKNFYKKEEKESKRNQFIKKFKKYYIKKKKSKSVQFLKIKNNFSFLKKAPSSLEKDFFLLKNLNFGNFFNFSNLKAAFFKRYLKNAAFKFEKLKKLPKFKFFNKKKSFSNDDGAFFKKYKGYNILKKKKKLNIKSFFKYRLNLEKKKVKFNIFFNFLKKNFKKNLNLKFFIKKRFYIKFYKGFFREFSYVKKSSKIKFENFEKSELNKNSNSENNISLRLNKFDNLLLNLTFNSKLSNLFNRKDILFSLLLFLFNSLFSKFSNLIFELFFLKIIFYYYYYYLDIILTPSYLFKYFKILNLFKNNFYKRFFILKKNKKGIMDSSFYILFYLNYYVHFPLSSLLIKQDIINNKNVKNNNFKFFIFKYYFDQNNIFRLNRLIKEVRYKKQSKFLKNNYNLIKKKFKLYFYFEDSFLMFFFSKKIYSLFMNFKNKKFQKLFYIFFNKIIRIFEIFFKKQLKKFNLQEGAYLYYYLFYFINFFINFKMFNNKYLVTKIKKKIKKKKRNKNYFF